jgi:hypothetical protein
MCALVCGPGAILPSLHPSSNPWLKPDAVDPEAKTAGIILGAARTTIDAIVIVVILILFAFSSFVSPY